jgi:hypothetical protein
MGKKRGNMATYDFSYAELWQLIDFSQFAEMWENAAYYNDDIYLKL